MGSQLWKGRQQSVSYSQAIVISCRRRHWYDNTHASTLFPDPATVWDRYVSAASLGVITSGQTYVYHSSTEKKN